MIKKFHDRDNIQKSTPLHENCTRMSTSAVTSHILLHKAVGKQSKIGFLKKKM